MNHFSYKILIADDHILFNDGVKSLLSNNYEITYQVYDGNEVIASILKHQPDLVLLDINLPKINGFQIAQKIKESGIKIKIVFLSMYSESDFIDQAKKIPVDGYMLKHSTKEELILAINAVINNEIYYDPKLKESKVNLHHDDYFVKKFSLSEREVEVISLIKQGLNSKAIAEKLFVSEETVKTHRKNIHYKLNVTNLAELIDFAHKNGI